MGPTTSGTHLKDERYFISPVIQTFTIGTCMPRKHVTDECLFLCLTVQIGTAIACTHATDESHFLTSAVQKSHLRHAKTDPILKSTGSDHLK